MFAKLRGIFLQKWDDQFRAESVEKSARMLEASLAEWGRGLVGLSAEQIKRGLDRCRVECEWPPSIAGFVRLCRSVDGWEHAGPAYRLHVRALPKPRAKSDVVRGEVAKMRVALRG